MKILLNYHIEPHYIAALYNTHIMESTASLLGTSNVATDYFDLILKVGSLAGLVGIIYQIHNNRKNKPSFKFTFEGSSLGNIDKNSNHASYIFSGIIRNTSLQPNSLVRLYLTVWENKRKGSVLRYGHVVNKIEDVLSKEQIQLPLYFEPKQARRLKIDFGLTIKGTSDERILNTIEEKIVGDTKVTFIKNKYEFLMEDVSGNMFDAGSSEISMELINRWWTLGNFAKKPAKYTKELLGILCLFLKWKLNKLIDWLGFYK